MNLRKVINAESCVPGCRWDLDLECGHTLEWVYVGHQMPRRKRCQLCEGIKMFSLKQPGDYSIFLDLSYKVPPEDRPRALLEWITHFMRADLLQIKIPGLDFGIALRITEEPALFPLPFDDGDWERPILQS